MKRFLLSLMVLVMLTPGLACAEFMGNQKSPTSHMAIAGMDEGMPCCPESDQKSDMGTMLFKDCAKIDLQQAGDAPLLKKVDVIKHTFPFIQAQVFNSDYSSIRNHAARGPPFERSLSLSAAHLPIFLVTQRLRI